MKIALICVYYPPLRSSCAIQMRDLAQELLAQGHEPIVFTPTESFRSAWECEVLGGVQVFRLAAFKTFGVGFGRRALSEILLSFTMLYGLRKSKFPIREIDAIVWYSPTIFFGPMIGIMRWIAKCPSYLILRDIFPEWALDLGVLKKGPAYYFFRLFAKLQYSVADTIGVQTSSNMDYMIHWAKKPGRRLEVLNNWLSSGPRAGSSILIENTVLRGRKIFVYVGNMGIAQGMNILVDLAENMKDRQDIGFLFVGRGTEAERLRTLSVDRKLDNILFYDEIDSAEIPGLLEMCDVGLIALDPRHKSHNIPGKLLSYLQVGLPILGRINAGTDLIRVIEGEDVGRVYLGGEVGEFRALAEEMIDDEKTLQKMSDNCRSLSQKMFSSVAAVNQIISSLSKCL